MDQVNKVGRGTVEVVKSVFISLMNVIKALGADIKALYTNRLLRFGFVAYIFGMIYKYRGVIKEYWGYISMAKNMLMMVINSFGNKLNPNELNNMTNEELLKHTNNTYVTTTSEYTKNMI